MVQNHFLCIAGNIDVELAPSIKDKLHSIHCDLEDVLCC